MKPRFRTNVSCMESQDALQRRLAVGTKGAFDEVMAGAGEHVDLADLIRGNDLLMQLLGARSRHVDVLVTMQQQERGPAMRGLMNGRQGMPITTGETVDHRGQTWGPAVGLIQAGSDTRGDAGAHPHAGLAVEGQAAGGDQGQKTARTAAEEDDGLAGPP